MEGDLFYPSQRVSGYAQVPHCFTEEHVSILNRIARFGQRHEENDGRVFYLIEEDRLK